MTVDTPPGGVPPRPTSLDPQQLGFVPQGPVPWLAPGQLAGTAVRVILSEQFGAYLDKRELQNALPSPVHDEGADEPEAWIDYVADVGDGFNATYSVAYLLSQPELTVGGERLPRGRALIMGGDEVYPTASSQRYEDRTKGPYRAARPYCEPGTEPSLYALPGNHDWYDGLTAFLRLFVKNGRDHIGGWRNTQARSYWAIRLPHRWWLMAVDTQFSAYIDDPQMAYFARVREQLREGDRVILAFPTPGWVEATNDPGAYDTIDYFVRTVLGGTGVDLKLMLAGDLHHYAHYSATDPGQQNDRHLITAGGGGAYLYPTHRLPDKIEVPPQASLVRTASPSRTYQLRTTFPDKTRSWGYATGVFARLPLRNKSFITLLGALHALYMLAVLNVVKYFHGTDLRLSAVPVGLMGAVVLGACVFFAVPPTAGKRFARHWLFGFGHGAVQLGLGVAGAFLWARLPFSHWPLWLGLFVTLIVYGGLAGAVATELVCLYLLVAGACGVNVNELFAGQGIEDAKSFLRLHITEDGLTVYPIGVPTVCRKWTVNPGGDPHESWVVPDGELDYGLAGPIIRIS